MPAPLPPLKKTQVTRLSFLGSPQRSRVVSSGGRPVDPSVIQMDADFDPIHGVGDWRFIQFPQDVHFDDYEQFERFVRRHLPVPADNIGYLLDYLHNFKTIEIDLRTGEVYPVVPRPTGFAVPLPLAGAPGPYLGGEG